MKRRLRALAAVHWSELPEADIAILARPASASVAFTDLESALVDLAARAARRRAPAPEKPAQEKPAPEKSVPEKPAQGVAS